MNMNTDSYKGIISIRDRDYSAEHKSSKVWKDLKVTK